jgi:glucosamine-6-phosphate deaminase
MFYIDRAAASELTREKTPWLVKHVEWDPLMAKRAVIWLSEKLEKAILTLEESDFYRNNLHDLVYSYGHVDNLCRTVFEDLRRRVTYKDGLIQNQQVVLFSPHPDDDVISMGGMLDKLVGNGNKVTVAYMTNGSVAVFDADVRRYLRFVEMSREVLSLDSETAKEMESRHRRMLDFLSTKKPGQVDIKEVQAIKAYIRYAEAMEGIEVMGLSGDNARFLDMPFYKTGRVRKDPIGEADVAVVLDLLNELRPDHVFVAGDLSDPHGTHRMCYQAIGEALVRYNRQLLERAGMDRPVEFEAETRPESGNGRPAEDGEARRPLVWLYRGAWQEWEIHRADVQAIYKHESQKDRAMFPGAYDDREFWQRARDRNLNTARALNKLGLPEFYAAEAFVTTYEL